MRGLTKEQRIEWMERAALKIVGRSVEIRFQVLNTDTPANACLYLDADGRPHMDIDPIWTWDDLELFRLFTHEVAHLKVHISRLIPMPIGARRFSPSKHDDSAIAAMEAEAEAFADQLRKRVDDPDFGLVDQLRRLAQ